MGCASSQSVGAVVPAKDLTSPSRDSSRRRRATRPVSSVDSTPTGSPRLDAGAAHARRAACRHGCGRSIALSDDADATRSALCELAAHESTCGHGQMLQLEPCLACRLRGITGAVHWAPPNRSPLSCGCHSHSRLAHAHAAAPSGTGTGAGRSQATAKLGKGRTSVALSMKHAAVRTNNKRPAGFAAPAANSSFRSSSAKAAAAAGEGLPTPVKLQQKQLQQQQQQQQQSQEELLSHHRPQQHAFDEEPPCRLSRLDRRRRHFLPEPRVRCQQCGSSRVPLGSFHAHVREECPRTVVRCEKCGEATLRCHQAMHEAALCSFRPVECAFGCGAPLLAAHQTIHQLVVCPKRPVPCPLGCGDTVPKDMVREHAASLCPLRVSIALVKRCLEIAMARVNAQVAAEHLDRKRLTPWHGHRNDFFAITDKVYELMEALGYDPDFAARRGAALREIWRRFSRRHVDHPDHVSQNPDDECGTSWPTPLNVYDDETGPWHSNDQVHDVITAQPSGPGAPLSGSSILAAPRRGRRSRERGTAAFIGQAPPPDRSNTLAAKVAAVAAESSARDAAAELARAKARLGRGRLFAAIDSGSGSSLPKQTTGGAIGHRRNERSSAGGSFGDDPASPQRLEGGAKEAGKNTAGLTVERERAARLHAGMPGFYLGECSAVEALRAQAFLRYLFRNCAHHHQCNNEQEDGGGGGDDDGSTDHRPYSTQPLHGTVTTPNSIPTTKNLGAFATPSRAVLLNEASKTKMRAEGALPAGDDGGVTCQAYLRHFQHLFAFDPVAAEDLLHGMGWSLHDQYRSFNLAGRGLGPAALAHVGRFVGSTATDEALWELDLRDNNFFRRQGRADLSAAVRVRDQVLDDESGTDELSRRTSNGGGGRSGRNGDNESLGRDGLVDNRDEEEEEEEEEANPPRGPGWAVGIFANGLALNTSLQTLRLCGNSLGKDRCRDLIAILESLAGHPSLTELTMRRSGLGVAEARAINTITLHGRHSSRQPRAPPTRTRSVAATGITLAAERVFHPLRVLDLSDNPTLGDAGTVTLVRGATVKEVDGEVEEHRGREQVYATQHEGGSYGSGGRGTAAATITTAAAAAAAAATTAEPLGPFRASEVGAGLNGTLRLSGCGVGRRGAAALCQALCRPGCSITHLDLSRNTLGSQGALNLAEVIRTNTGALAILNLRDTALGIRHNATGATAAVADSSAAAILVGALAYNPSVVALDVADNCLEGDRFTTALAGRLASASGSLTALSVSGNPLGESGLLSIIEALRETLALTSLDISNTTGGARCPAIGRAIADIFLAPRPARRRASSGGKAVASSRPALIPAPSQVVSATNNLLDGKRNSPATDFSCGSESDVIRSSLRRNASVTSLRAANIIADFEMRDLAHALAQSIRSGGHIRRHRRTTDGEPGSDSNLYKHGSDGNEGAGAPDWDQAASFDERSSRIDASEAADHGMALLSEDEAEVTRSSVHSAGRGVLTRLDVTGVPLDIRGLLRVDLADKASQLEWRHHRVVGTTARAGSSSIGTSSSSNSCSSSGHHDRAGDATEEDELKVKSDEELLVSAAEKAIAAATKTLHPTTATATTTNGSSTPLHDGGARSDDMEQDEKEEESGEESEDASVKSVLAVADVIQAFEVEDIIQNHVPDVDRRGRKLSLIRGPGDVAAAAKGGRQRQDGGGGGGVGRGGVGRGGVGPRRSTATTVVPASPSAVAQSLTTLNLSSQCLVAGDGILLGSLLGAGLHGLIRVDLSRNHLATSLELCPTAAGRGRATGPTVRATRVTRDGLVALARGVARAPTLKILDLSSNVVPYDPSEGHHDQHYDSHNHSVHPQDYPQDQSEGALIAAAFALALENPNCKLEELCLSDMVGLPAHAATAFADALAVNTTLRRLGLAGNRLGRGREAGFLSFSAESPAALSDKYAALSPSSLVVVDGAPSSKAVSSAGRGGGEEEGIPRAGQGITARGRMPESSRQAFDALREDSLISMLGATRDRRQAKKRGLEALTVAVVSHNSALIYLDLRRNHIGEDALANLAAIAGTGLVSIMLPGHSVASAAAESDISWRGDGEGRGGGGGGGGGTTGSEAVRNGGRAMLPARATVRRRQTTVLAVEDARAPAELTLSHRLPFLVAWRRFLVAATGSGGQGLLGGTGRRAPPGEPLVRGHDVARRVFELAGPVRTIVVGANQTELRLRGGHCGVKCRLKPTASWV